MNSAEKLASERYATASAVRDQALRVLAQDHPEIDARILMLFGWLGHSLGPWSGFPFAEGAPVALLETFSHEDAVGAVQRNNLTVHQKEGAARFFCRWIHPQRRQVERREIPSEVRALLWAYVQSTRDEDKIKRATRVLGA